VDLYREVPRFPPVEYVPGGYDAASELGAMDGARPLVLVAEVALKGKLRPDVGSWLVVGLTVLRIVPPG
jgi:hypothetical protein